MSDERVRGPSRERERERETLTHYRLQSLQAEKEKTESLQKAVVAADVKCLESKAEVSSLLAALQCDSALLPSVLRGRETERGGLEEAEEE